MDNDFALYHNNITIKFFFNIFIIILLKNLSSNSYAKIITK